MAQGLLGAVRAAGGAVWLVRVPEPGSARAAGYSTGAPYRPGNASPGTLHFGRRVAGTGMVCNALSTERLLVWCRGCGMVVVIQMAASKRAAPVRKRTAAAPSWSRL